MRNIKEVVQKLKDKYNTNDPYKICDELDIWVYKEPLGKIKGHYTKYEGVKVFFINDNLNHVESKFCCAHELGHAILHPDSNKYFNMAYTYFIHEKAEIEADKFAAELLIDDELIEEYKGYSIETISNATGIDSKYLELKLK